MFCRQTLVRDDGDAGARRNDVGGRGCRRWGCSDDGRCRSRRARTCSTGCNRRRGRWWSGGLADCAVCAGCGDHIGVRRNGSCSDRRWQGRVSRVVDRHHEGIGGERPCGHRSGTTGCGGHVCAGRGSVRFFATRKQKRSNTGCAKQGSGRQAGHRSPTVWG